MQQQNNNNDLIRYAGMGAQIFASLGIGVFVGYKLDQWIKISFPVFVWLLPLMILAVFIYKLIKETSKRKN